MKSDRYPEDQKRDADSDAQTFEQVREDIEARQKALLWEEARRGGRSVDEFLWNGDPDAKPIQRAGLIVFAFIFLLISAVFVSIPFEKGFEGWGIEFGFALFSLFISLRFIRNAFLHKPRSANGNGIADEGPSSREHLE